MPRQGLRKRKSVHPKRVSIAVKPRPRGRPPKKVKIVPKKSVCCSTATTLSPTPSFLAEVKKDEVVNEHGDGTVFPFGLLYSERLHSFLRHGWPFSKPKQACNPHKLAMAGLMYGSIEPMLSVKCFVCFHTIGDLTEDSDPWQLHSAVNPACALVNLGYPEKPDNYSMSQILDLCEESWENKLEEASEYCEHYLMEALRRITVTETSDKEDL